MKSFTLAVAFALLAAPAYAIGECGAVHAGLLAPLFAQTACVPEVDAGAGVLALAFIAGAGAIIREKFRRK